MKRVAKNGGERGSIRQLLPPRAHPPRAGAKRAPRDFIDDAVSLGIIGGCVGNAAVDVAAEAGNDRIKIDEELIDGTSGRGICGIGNSVVARRGFSSL